VLVLMPPLAISEEELAALLGIVRASLCAVAEELEHE
jgi:adenosylmethionine-8-amino-7-oxononanoate aminotransferase